MRTKYLVAILVLLALALPASPARAGGVVSVCDEAHLLAALAGGGTVTFSCSGTITLTQTINISSGTTIDGSGQSVTISGNNAVQMFNVKDYTGLSLVNLTIADGNGGIFTYEGIIALGNVDFSSSNVYVDFGTLTMVNSTFSGGGIYSGHGSAIVSNSTVSGSHITNDWNVLVVKNSLFTNSRIWSRGAVSNMPAPLTVSDSTFSNVTCGIDNYRGLMTVNNSTFSGNTVGICVGSGMATVTNSTFSGNDTAISNRGEVTVSNSTFSGNDTGISNGGEVTVSNSTFSGNNGGITSDYGEITLKNTIVANSSSGENCSGSVTDGGGNLSWPDTTCPGINADPKLGPLQDNGGPTETMALGPGSAAIDAGDDSICAAPPVNGLDQRGVIRPHGLHCDIGAVEQVNRYFPLLFRK